MDEFFRINAQSAALSRRQTFNGDFSTETAIEFRTSQQAEQSPIQRRHLDEPLISGKAVGLNGLGTGLRNDRVPASCDIRQGLVPRRPHKPACAFGADSLQRMQNPIRVIDTIKIVIDLGTQCTARERMVRISIHPLGLAVSDFNLPCTRIRTIMATRPANDG